MGVPKVTADYTDKNINLNAGRFATRSTRSKPKTTDKARDSASVDARSKPKASVVFEFNWTTSIQIVI